MSRGEKNNLNMYCEDRTVVTLLISIRQDYSSGINIFVMIYEYIDVWIVTNILLYTRQDYSLRVDIIYLSII